MFSFEELYTKPRKAARSYSELLPWFAQIAPGLVLCQDGSLLAGYTLAGSDVEGREDFVADQKIDQLQAAFRALNDRVTMWTVQERRFVSGYPNNVFVSPVATAIDQQWRESLEKRKNAVLTQRVFLGYNFPNKSEAFFEALRAEVQAQDGNFFKALKEVVTRKLVDKGAIAQVRGQLAEMVGEFERVLTAFSGIVELQLGFKRIKDEEFLGELYARANLASPKGAVNVPAGGVYLNTYLATDTIVRQHDQFEFKGPSKSAYVAALSTTGTPLEAFSGDMDALMGVDAEYVLVQVFKFLDRQVAEKEIQDAEQFYKTEVKSVMTRTAERVFDTVSEKENTGNLALAQDAQQALVEMTTDDIAYGYYNMTLLAIGDSKRQAETSIETLASAMRARGYTVLRERQGLLPAILATVPGNANAIMRWKMVSAANLADLAPIRTISPGESTHPLFSRLAGTDVPPMIRFLTPHGVTYDFNPHATDLGHTAIIGGAGAGKTSLVTLLMTQFQKYKPSQTFIFDKDHSLMMATVLLGGKYTDFSAKGSKIVGTNPVRVMMKAGDDLRLRQWIEVVITAGGNDVSPQESQEIFVAIQQLRQTPESRWRLAAIVAYIAGSNKKLAAKLAPYVDTSDDEDDILGKGAFAPYFDNYDDNLELASLIAMECGGILENSRLASPFMDYVFWSIEQRLDGTTPTLIYVEEAWYMLSNQAFANKMEDWLRTFRKKRAFVVFATQALDELARLPNIGSFVTNIPCQILLPAVKNSVHQQADLYRDIFGINDEQLNLLSGAIPKRDYLLVKPDVTRLVSTQMPPLLIAINEATTQPLMREKVLEAQQAKHAGWEMKFVREVLNVAV